MSGAAQALDPMPAGYVEATTATAVLGWAWVPGQAGAVTVELRLGGVVVAQAVADELRDDLARGGIGEGRHAFTLMVPEAQRARLAELQVFVRGPGGEAVPLGSPPPEDGIAARLAKLERGMEMLVGSQRVLHRNLQAALLARGEAREEGSGQTGTTARQAAVDDSIGALEQFVVRLEASLAGVAVPAREAPRGGLAIAAGVTGAALVGSAWALLRALPG